MRPGTCSALVLCTLFAASGFASPLSSRLLPLVPSGVQIVAGFQNHSDSSTHGRLLLSTHNNRLDLDDWQALSGVDHQRLIEEVIEVAGSASGGDLSEHLLLVAGRFDRERIYAAAEQNGAGRVPCQDQIAMVIKPFAREHGDMLDTRWLVILDNRIGVFGTQFIVRQALLRYASHALPDSILEQRLSQLRPDVTSWNVLVALPKFVPTISFAQPRSAWAQLQEGADVLMVAARFGTKIRVDFLLNASPELGPAFFDQKAALFLSAFAHELPHEAASPNAPEARLQSLSVESNRVQGSIELSDKQFELWCLEVGRLQPRIQIALVGAQRGD